MILVSPAMLRYLNDPTPENKARLKPSDLVARDTFTGEKMKLEETTPRPDADSRPDSGANPKTVNENEGRKRHDH